MKPLIYICVVLLYLAKVVGSTVRKNSVEIHIKDGSHSPNIVHIRDRAQKLRTLANKHHSDYSSEIKHRKVLQDRTYSTMHNVENTGEGFVNTANWTKPYNSANKIADAVKSWSTSWGSNSKSNGGATDNSAGNGGQWSWSTSGGNKGTSGNSASNGGSNGGQWSTSGGNTGTSGGSNGGQWSTSGGNKGTSGNSASNGGSNGGQWSWSTSGGETSGGNLGGAAGGNMGGAVGGNLGGAVGGNLGGSVGGKMGGAVGGKMGGAAGGNMGGAAGGNMGGAVGGNLGGAVGGNLGGSVGGKMGGTVGGNMGGSVGGNMGGAVGGKMGGAVGGNLGGSVGGKMGGAVGGNLGGSVGGNMGGAVGGNMGGSVGGNMGGAVGGNMGGAVGGNMGGAAGGNLGGSVGGNMGGATGGGGIDMNIGFGGAGGLGGGISSAGGLGGGMSLNLGRTGNGGYLSAKGKFVFSQRIKEYQQDVLQTHNKYRKIHNARALRLDPKLSKAAMAYARTLANSVKKIRHSQSFTNIKVGENLLMSAVPITGATVVKAWYDQVYKYDFKKHRGKDGAPYSAFVQIVWRKTRRIGVGRAVGKVKGEMFVFYCARYQPTGYVGTKRNFRRNVRRGKFKGMVAGQNGIAGGNAGGFGVMEDLQSFISSALNTHNMLRSMHGVPALRLSRNLCRAALMKTTPDESGGIVSSEAGMNVFDICQGTMSGDAVTKEWYKDVCFYDFGQQDSPRQTKSEFRQVIWKDSKYFGISYKVYRKEKKTCVRIVALYRPAMEEANINLHDQVKKGKFLGCQNGVFTYKGGITVSQCG